MTDRKPDDAVWSFRDMTLVERAALRVLCMEAVHMIDQSAKEAAR